MAKTRSYKVSRGEAVLIVRKQTVDGEQGFYVTEKSPVKKIVLRSEYLTLQLTLLTELWNWQCTILETLVHPEEPLIQL